MANKEQLAILTQGVEAWNKWREEHPDAKIDLRGAKLEEKNLSRINFSKADIRGTSFKGSSLKETTLLEAKAGYSLAGTGFQILLLLLFLIMSGVILISTYISCAVLLEILLFLYRNHSVSILILSILSILIMIILPGVFILKYRNEDAGNMRTDAVSNIYLIFSISLIALFLSFIVFVIFSSTDGSFKISGIMMPEKIVKITNGKKKISMGNANIAMIYMAFFIMIILYVFRQVFLENQNFSFLRRSWLVTSTILGTDFRKADLTGTIFDKAYLKHVRFGKAILTDTSFNDVKGLQFTRCNETILDDRDVRELLVRGNGQELYLKSKNLQGAHLVNADLRDLDLRETDLMQANLSGADITGAKLWGSARENWIIDGIRCEYVYWDEAGKVRTPPDRNFRPGEFEELYKQLPTFEYVFSQGFTPLDPLIMDRVVQAVNERHKEFSLELVNFDKRGEPHATFTVCHLDYVEKAKEQLSVLYEKTISYLMKENEDNKRKIDRLHDFIDQLIKKTPSVEGLKMGDTYNNYGQVAAMGKEAAASSNTFQQITADLSLSHLHEEMRRTASNPEQHAAAEDVAKAEQAARQQDESTMQRHLKNAGRFALDCAKEIGAEALAEYLKKMTLGG